MVTDGTAAVGVLGTVRVAIIGGGLIGCSLALALGRLGDRYHCALLDRDPAVVARIRALGIGQKAHTDPATIVADCDIILFCVPVLAMPAAAAAVAPHLPTGAIVSDAGSVKGSVVAALRAALPAQVIVPGHPIAGRETSGPDAALADLFDQRLVMLCPALPGADAAAPNGVQARGSIAALWRDAGAEVRDLALDAHDSVYALVSHMPHAVSYALARSVSDGLPPDLQDSGGGALRDMTRIAGSDPVMWRDIFLANRDALLSAMDAFTGELVRLRGAIAAADGDAIATYIRSANTAHTRVKPRGTPPGKA